jgi:hypothetical protein
MVVFVVTTDKVHVETNYCRAFELRACWTTLVYLKQQEIIATLKQK